MSGRQGGGPQDDQESPPYESRVHQFGGIPGVMPDVPICALFLALYIGAGLIHQIVFIKNKKKGQKFVMSAMTFGFCAVRLITFSTRLAWGTSPGNASLALVSNIFLNAGIPILFIINLVFTHRITRAQHPRWGWHKSLSIGGKVLIALIVAVLVLLIYSGIQLAFTRDDTLINRMRDIQLFGATFYCFIAFIPIPMLIIGVVIPKRVRTEKFGSGRFRVKIAVLVASSLLLTIRSLWGTISAYQTPVYYLDPLPWYFGKLPFYIVQLMTELIVVYMFIFVRINRIFYTPDGIPRGSYLTLPTVSQMNVNSLNPPPYGEHNFPTTTTLRVYSEEELFEDQNALADTLRYSSASLLLDNQSGKWKLERPSMSDIYSPSTEYAGSHRPHSRGSMTSSYYYRPGEAPSATASRPSSLYSPNPNSWTKERYEKERDRRDSTGSHGNGTPTHLWSSQKGVEMRRISNTTSTTASRHTSYNPPPPSQPQHDATTLAALQAAEAEREQGRRRIASTTGQGSNFQNLVDSVMRDTSQPPSPTGSSTPRGRSPRGRASSASAGAARRYSGSGGAGEVILEVPRRVVPVSPRVPDEFEGAGGVGEEPHAL